MNAMNAPARGAAAACLLLCALSAAAHAANVTGFEDLSLTVTVYANKDGTAHVNEEVQLAVSQTAVDLYKQSLLSTALTIEDWKNTTGSVNLRYHVLGANVTPLNTRLFPRPLERLAFANKSIAVITVEYDTSGPVFRTAALGPRRTSYTFIGDTLSFENGQQGTVLPEDATLVIRTLPNSRVDLSKTRPRPTSPLDDDQVVSATAYVWNASGGAFPLTPFEFSFETEDSLDQEISDYFKQAQEQLTSLVFSGYGIASVFVAGVLVAMFLVLKRTDAI
jgi:hypothetical protein